jgi:hypothetical protein
MAPSLSTLQAQKANTLLALFSRLNLLVTVQLDAT